MASATWAIASRICSSSQPASRASSWRWRFGAPVRLEQGLHEAEQHRLLLVARVELTREGDLVHSEAGVAARALERGERVLAPLVLCDGERDALLGRVGERAVAQLGAHARVRAQHRRRPGEHADEVRELASARECALENGTLPSGAVSSSWTWNLLSFVFMALHFPLATYLG